MSRSVPTTSHSKPSAPVPQSYDHSDLASLSVALQRTANELGGMVQEVAKAKTIKEAAHDRLKRALAVNMRQGVLDGEAVSKCETLARSSEQYGLDLQRLTQEYQAAEEVLTRYEAVKIRFEAERSALAAMRQIAGLI